MSHSLKIYFTTGFIMPRVYCISIVYHITSVELLNFKFDRADFSIIQLGPSSMLKDTWSHFSF